MKECLQARFKAWIKRNIISDPTTEDHARVRYAMQSEIDAIIKQERRCTK